MFGVENRDRLATRSQINSMGTYGERGLLEEKWRSNTPMATLWVLYRLSRNSHRAKLWSRCCFKFEWVVDSCEVRIKSGKVAYCVINENTWTWTAFPDLMRTPQLSTTHSNLKQQLL